MNKIYSIKMTLVSLMLVSHIYCAQLLHSEKQLQESSIHPAWYYWNTGKDISRDRIITQYRTICNQLGLTENPKIPKKSSDIIRIATYNVHFWKNPYAGWGEKDKRDFDEMIKVIKMIDADILILEEVGGESMSWGPEFNVLSKEMGYEYSVFGSIAEGGPDKPGNLYNCILSKYPFITLVRKQYQTNPALDDPTVENPEQRNFVGAQIQLPNDKKISVYGTHLEVRPIKEHLPSGEVVSLTPKEVHEKQLRELISYIDANDTNENVLIGADFNELRKQDLQHLRIGGKTLWDILQGLPEQLSFQQPISLQPLEYLAQQKYRDSFEMGRVMPPAFTVWIGTRIDFLFLKSTWKLPIAGCYVFYSWASDHIPVIMDVNIR